MRILYLFPQLPYPPESGGRIITFEYVKHFLRKHQVWIVSLKHKPEDKGYAEILERMGANVILADAPPRISFGTLLKSFFSKSPYKAHRFYSEELAEMLARLMGSVQFDVIHAQNFYMAQYINGHEKAKTIYYKENYEGLLLKRYAATLKNPVSRLFWRNEARKTTWYEIELAKRFDKVLCISSIDAERFRKKAPEIDWEVLPATIDLNVHRFSPQRGNSRDLLFLGMLNYFPNIDGAEFFVKEVMPLVRQEVPDARLNICGHSPAKKVRRLGREEGVNVIGPIPDAQKALEECSVFVIPLRIGGGVRLKLLQCLSAGIPVVSTSIGCEGINVQDGRDILIADEPRDFARKLVRLLKDETLRSNLVHAGRQLIETQYSPKVVLEKLERIYTP